MWITYRAYRIFLAFVRVIGYGPAALDSPPPFFAFVPPFVAVGCDDLLFGIESCASPLFIRLFFHAPSF